MKIDPTRLAGRSARRRRFVRRAAWGLLLAIVAVGVGLWIARDLPRRWLERRLADELDAEVRLGRLEVLGPDRFVLSDLDVRRPGWEPRLERVIVERLEVGSALGEIRANRFDRLIADGVEVRLTPPARPAEPAPATAVLVRELEVRRGRVVASGPAGESALDFTARIRDWGAEPSGEIGADAARLDLAPWLALLGQPRGDGLRGLRLATESARIDLVLSPEPELLRLAARGGPLTVGQAARDLRLSQWKLDATVARDAAGGRLRIDARPEFPGVESAHLVAQLDPETLEIERGHASLSGIALATLLASGATLPEGWVVEGQASLEAGTEDGTAFDYRAAASIERLELPIARGRVEARGTSVLASGTWRRGEPRVVYEVEAAAAAVTLAAPWARLDFTACRVDASGGIDPSAGGPVLARLRVADGRGDIRGGVVPPEVFPLELSADGKLDLESVARYSGKLGLRAPGGGDLEAAGTIDAAAEGVAADVRWSWSRAPGLSDLRASAARLGFTLPPEIAVEGRARATGTLEGRLSDPGLRGRVDLDELGISADVDTGTRGGGRWSLARGAGHAVFAREPGAGERVSIEKIELSGDLVHAVPAGPGEAFERRLVVTGRGALGVAGAVEIEEATASIDGLARLRLRGRLDTGGAIAASASVDGVELARLREVGRLWVDDPAPDYEVKGTFGAEVDAERSPDGRFGARGTLDLGGIGFSSPDGSRVVEGGASRLSFELEGGPEANLEARAQGAATGPLLLWGTLFGDYSKIESRIEIAAHRQAGGWESTVAFDLPRDVRVTARVASPADTSRLAGERSHVEYAATAEVPDLGALLEEFVRGPFEGSVAGIDALEAAGRLRIDLRGELGAARRTVQGALEVSGASFSGGGGATSVAGLELVLPVDLEWRPGDPAAGVVGPERAGSLAVERLRLAGVDFPPVRTALTVEGDAVRLDRPQRLALLGGHVDLEQLALVDWSRASRHMRFGLVLDDLNLAALSAALGTFPLEGRVDGAFSAVRLTPERLQVDGGGGIDVFGGRVEIFDISGTEVLGRFPRLAFSARFDGIRLLDVTRTVDFGEVEGVVRGEIRDCELFRGTPVRCEADLHSVETPGVPQRISVKAIRNISILGSGSHVGLLDRGLQTFFDRYTYTAIGIEMGLERDRFLLRGTERRGEKELFVKGRLPFRIDIVNVAPGHAVSFQTMLARLGNLEIRTTPPPRKSGEVEN